MKTISSLTKNLSEQDQLEIDASVISGRFVHEIDKLRINLGLTKEQLAEKLSVSPSYLTQVFCGDKQINTKFLAKVQKELGVRVEINVTPIDVDS